MPGRHSLFWKLACLLVAFCLLMIWLSWSWGRYMEQRNQVIAQRYQQAVKPAAQQNLSLSV